MVAVTYRTSTVARLAGAASLPAILAVWGVGYLLLAGETTVTTWALGLAVLFPASALLLGVAGNWPPSRPGVEYALGLLGAVVTLSVAYIALAATGSVGLAPLVGLGPGELLVVGAVSALLGGALAVVDVRYVERPATAARLEERYLDEPVRGD